MSDIRYVAWIGREIEILCPGDMIEDSLNGRLDRATVSRKAPITLGREKLP